jgi:hypothetical protein
METPQPSQKGPNTILIVVLVLVALCVIIPICVICLLALLGPAIGNVFSNIIQNMTPVP